MVKHVSYVVFIYNLTRTLKLYVVNLRNHMEFPKPIIFTKPAPKAIIFICLFFKEIITCFCGRMEIYHRLDWVKVKGLAGYFDKVQHVMSIHQTTKPVIKYLSQLEIWQKSLYFAPERGQHVSIMFGMFHKSPTTS